MQLGGSKVTKSVDMNKPPRKVVMQVNGTDTRRPARLLGKIDSDFAPFVVVVRYETGEMLYRSDEDGLIYDIRTERLAYMRVVKA